MVTVSLGQQPWSCGLHWENVLVGGPNLIFINCDKKYQLHFFKL